MKRVTPRGSVVVLAGAAPRMEHSSILKFLEWNFLGKETGQLGGRDKAVHNIGSLLDPSLGVPDGEP